MVSSTTAGDWLVDGDPGTEYKGLVLDRDTDKLHGVVILAAQRKPSRWRKARVVVAPVRSILDTDDEAHCVTVGGRAIVFAAAESIEVTQGLYDALEERPMYSSGGRDTEPTVDDFDAVMKARELVKAIIEAAFPGKSISAMLTVDDMAEGFQAFKTFPICRRIGALLSSPRQSAHWQDAVKDCVFRSQGALVARPEFAIVPEAGASGDSIAVLLDPSGYPRLILACYLYRPAEGEPYEPWFTE